MKVTLVPAQMVVADATILTDGATVAVTVITIAFEVAVVGLAQARDEVITTVISSPLPSPAF